MVKLGLSISVSALSSLAEGVLASFSGGQKPLFELRPGPFVQNEFVVMELHGQEGMSKLFEFEVTVASRVEADVNLAGLAEDAFGSAGKALGMGAAGKVVGRVAGSLVADAESSALEMVLLGQPATLIIHSPCAPPRVVQGICTDIERLGPLGGESSDWLGYRLIIRPRLWLGTLRKNSRIFQDVTIHEIVDTILAEHRVPVSWAGGSKLPTRSYTVQHQETDYDFIKRLLAEAGYFYYFEPPHGLVEELAGCPVVGGLAQVGAAFGGPLGQLANVAGLTEKLIIADAASCYPPIVAGDGSNLWEKASGIAGAASDAVGQASAAARGSASGGFRLDSSGVHLGGALTGGLAGGAAGIVGALGKLAFSSPILVFRELSGLTGTEDFVYQLTYERSLRPKRVTLKDYDYNHPSLNLTAHAKANSGLAGAFEGEILGTRLLSLNTEAPATALINTQELEIYDHHDEYQETDVNRDHSRIQLEQYRRDTRVAVAQSVSQRLVPGYRFLLEDHPLRICNKEFVVTHVEHWGQTPEWKQSYKDAADTAEPDPVETLNYRNQFECVPAGIAYRMPRPPRVLQQVAETAIVVGPETNEIHTDERGRIKVRFFWDRESKNTCWVRVMQPMSGGGWGHQFIPRVGMEVVVVFLGGDPDKPVVAGCVPNEHHRMPFPLPSATRSGIRTQSTPGGGGWNELSFEDAKGRELFHLRAERDLNELVQHNRISRICNDDNIRVDRDRIEQVGRNQFLHTDGNCAQQVIGNTQLHVHGTQIARIDGNADSYIGRDSTTRIDGTERHEVASQAEYAHNDDLTLQVAGCYSVLVGQCDAKRSAVLHVEGTVQVSSSDMTEIVADKGLCLRCGESSIFIGPNAVEIRSPTVSIAAADAGFIASNGKTRLTAKEQATIIANKLMMKSSEATIGLGKNVKIDAPKIKLNCKPDSTEDESKPEAPPPPTRIQLRSKSNEPIAHQRFIVRLKNGSEYSGFLDKEGMAVLGLDPEGYVTFPDLDKVEQ